MLYLHFKWVLVLFFSLLSFAFLFFGSFLFASEPVLLKEPKAMTYIEEKLPHEGILSQTEKGFLYVALSREYVFELLPLFSEKNICPPPYFKEGFVGAHITVALESELRSLKVKVPFLGQKISFLVLDISEVSLENSSLKADKAYLITIKSSQIEEIRKELGLPPKIKNHEFHITIGISCP